MKRIFLATVLSCAFLGLQAQEFYEKHVVFPSGATLEQKVDMASRLIPTPQQLEWQQMELSCFIHFGMNTFTDLEWGTGKEDPDQFYPTELNCEQWVRTLEECGFKSVVLTAKHHDGFCLWPTKTTKHSVASSRWKNGKGDVVRELREACDKYGLKLGLYLSPWDRNAESYGKGDAYNKFFIEQLTELLTNYGDVCEVWFDGFCGEGPNGKKQDYDWDSILKTIHQLQPQALVSILGDDVRWIGNEQGRGNSTEWCPTPLTPEVYARSYEQNKLLGITYWSEDLGSRDLISKANELFWFPSVVNTSIRPGWFYHPAQNNQVHPLSKLVDTYFNSVGSNSMFLLNIPPDQRGLFHENDLQRLKEWSAYIKKTFKKNLIANGGSGSVWKARAGESKEYTVKNKALFNTILLQENISQGQRIEKFTVEAYRNGNWYYLTEGTTVGNKRLIRFADSQAEKVRLTINSSRNTVNVSNVGLYYAAPLKDGHMKIKISDVPSDGWKLMTEATDAQKAIDGKPETAWKTESLSSLVVDMGEKIEIAGFCYAPTQEKDLTGTIYKYNFYVSTNGNDWIKCNTSGEFSNIVNNPIPIFVHFGKKYPARYFKLEPITEINAKQITTIGEVGILLE